MLQSLVRPIKSVLPRGSKARVLRFGPAAGAVMAIDFKTQLRPYLGLFEPELNPWFRKLIKRGDDCFDLGGADGYSSLLMAQLSRGRVVSFECDPQNAALLRSNFALNATLSLQVVEAFVGASDAPGFITIDHAAQEIFPPQVIKVDIEGAEADALRGAASTLTKHRPKWIIEAHSKDNEEICTRLLRDANYSVHIINQSSLWRDSWRWGYNRWLVAEPR